MSKYKNYIILGVALLLTIVLAMYALKWYDVYKEAMKNKAIISDYISEIKLPELKTYISDKHNAVVYFGITDDSKCRSFERRFKDTISKYQLTEEVVYLSVNDLRGDNLAKDLDDTYGTEVLRSQKKVFNKVPALAIYVNGVMVDFVNGSKLTQARAVKLLEQYDYINDWE